MSGDLFGSIAGKTILYTGAAGGLGHETTLQMLRSGARVVAVDNDATKIAALKQAVADEALDGLSIEALDLSDLSNLRRALEAVSARVGGFDIVINNAAIYPSKPFEEYTIEEMQRVQLVNVDAAIVCVQVALPHMKMAGRGRIINIASITFSGGWANLTPYVQSKGALIGLARAWAREFGKHGITVNVVSPGAFPTDAEKIHPDLEGYTRRIFDHQALQRRGTSNDIANLLMFLASDASSFITGQTINIDGGWVMQ
ncbi:3-oxoacyl-[acyl-carrier protein] reductase [Devosia sp. UYZn731]|uniref:SDR family NAD(P)-dependent oxidoreductase n=1 Tax=Devosia sp. UYZn731 TaxID=3156345 RepID=UPI003395DF33